MNKLVRRTLLAACAFAAAALAPTRGNAQERTIPPLYPTSPPDTAKPAPDTTGLSFRVSAGATRGAERTPSAPGQRLGDADAARLLARARPLAADSARRDSFAFPARTLPAPRAGTTRLAPFPPPDTATAPAVPGRTAPAPLAVTRRAPEGEVPLGAEVTVTFSQPMVPLSSVANVAARDVPVRLAPQPAGRWSWVDVRTVRFEPEGRLPNATRYTVTVPAGTVSATGARLAEAVSWSFATPAPRATGAWPQGGPIRLQPVMVVAFDQRVDPAAVLATVRVRAGGTPVEVRAATAAEVQADVDARSRVRGLVAGRWIAFRPVRPLPGGAQVRVTVGPGTPSLEGPLRTADTQRWDFSTFGVLRFVEQRCGYDEVCRPGMRLTLAFSNPLADSVFDASLVRVTPAIPGMSVSSVGSMLVIDGATRPFTRYTVRVDGALRDQFGQRLGTPVTRTFQVGAPLAQLWTGAERVVVLDPLGPRSVSVYARDHARLRIRVHRVSAEDWPRFQQSRDSRKAMTLPGVEVVNQVRATGGATGETREIAVDINAALRGGLGQAIVAVEAVEGTTEQERGQAIYLWVQSTRIGVAAFTDGTRMTAWASSLVDGQPLDGVDFRLLPAGVAGKTGADGLATLPLPAPVDREAFLIARRGDDVAILAPGMGEAGWARWMARDTTRQAMWHSFTDRNLYRPGETVKFKGWLRWMRPGVDGGLTLPAVGDVTYTVRDPRGEELAKGTARLTALGGFDGSFALPAGANLGQAYVLVTPSGGRGQHMIPFVVQEFRRPEYEVSVTADPGPHFVGGGTEVIARASYFSGGGLAGAPVEWEVESTPGFYDPPGWDRFSFGIRPPWWWWLDGDDDEVDERSFEGVTDVNGAHSLRIDFDSAAPPRPYSVTAEATVTDVNRQTWTSSASMLVHPAAVYLGMRTERSWLEAGDTLDLELVAVDLDGRVVPGRAIEVRARRSEWRFENGRSRIVEVSDERCSRVSENTPVRCAFAVTGGDYTVEATTTDDRGRATITRLRVWVTGPGVRFPGRNDDDDNAARTVEMIPDRQTYAVGDTARILLRLPFQPARGIVSIRQGGLVRTEELRADGATHTLRIPITERDVPNVWVQVDVNGATAGTDDPAVARGVDAASGSVQLPVPPVTRTLTVLPVPADSTLRPDAESSVEVEVRDAAGRPVADAEVALVVVDEAVLALTGYRISNPLAAFYPERGPDVEEVRLRPLVRVVVPELAPAPGTLVGRVINAANGEEVGGARVSVAGTALSAETDAHGRFRIRGVTPGAVTVVVEQDGFPDTRQAVSVGAGATPSLRLYLVPQGARVMVRGASSRADFAAQGAMAEQAMAMDASMPMPAPPAPPPPPVMMEGKVPGMVVQQAPAPIAARTNFDPLAVWMAAARTDARGRVRVPFRIPSNLTRYRVSAVAVHGATRYGMGESAITARQPLMVRPSPPRFLNFGDRFELPVVLQNGTGAAMDVMVAARADGVTFTEPGRHVTVPAHDRVEVRLPAEAREAGTAHFQVVAAAGAETDAAEFTLPVYTPATAEAFATYGTLTGGAVTLPLDVPTDAIPSFGGLEVSTTSTALHELTDAFLYLARYPYQGTEQISSRMLAVAALRDVLGALNAEGLPAPDSIRASVDADARALAARQNGDGGFAAWERGERTWPYASIHAAHALQRAREAGYTVPQPLWEGALRYIRSVPRNLPADYPAEVRRALHAYALYVRQRAGDDVSGPVREVVAGAGGANAVPLEVAGWLLPAAAANPRLAATRDSLLQLVNNRATETASTATFATRYTEGEYLLLHSNRRTDAVVLEGLLAADPRNELVGKAVRGLLGNRVRGRWGNTQENAWVLLAVQRYFRAYEAQTPDFVARVWLGERFAGSGEFRGRSAERVEIDVPMRALQETRPGSVTIGQEGTGRLYYRAGLRYAPRDLTLTPLQRGFTVERTYEAVDSAADVTRGADGIWRVRGGARVRVTVTLTAPSRRLHVALVDPLPAGWEPVNEALRGSQPADDDARGRDVVPLRVAPPGWWGRWWEHQNLRDDRAEAFATLLPAGVYTYSYVARATTPGLFIVPPPRAEEMYSPETFGRGGTERVIVLPPDESRP